MNTYRKTAFFIALMLMLTICNCKVSRIGQAEEGLVSIFDGKTLSGWLGDSTYWRVENGNLVGLVTPATLLKRNSFIVWQGRMPSDFELKVEYRVSAEGNSGINYRSEYIEGAPYALRGYQADICGSKWGGGANIVGSNYEERRRTTIARVGQAVRLPDLKIPFDSLSKHIQDNQWVPKIITRWLGNPDSLRLNVKNEDWNEYHLIVKGNHLQHYVNGVLMSDVIDDDTQNRRFDGLLGVRVHVGGPMKIEYRNFRLKALK